MSQATIDQTQRDADQAEFDADMAHLRQLVDQILDQADRTGEPPASADFLPAGTPHLAELQGDFDLQASWPYDAAADLLDDWRHGPVRHGAYCPCGSRLEIRGELDAEDYEAISDFEYAHQDCTASQDADEDAAVPA